MTTNTNSDIILSIKRLKKDQNLYGRRSLNESLLSDYKKICEEIKSVNTPKFDNLNVYNSLEIHLYHPEINEITIYNEEDWKFLYNYNIIQECIKKGKIKIDFELKNPNKTFNMNLRKMNFRKIISYIMRNIPQNFYFNIMVKFFREYIQYDFVDLFISYIIDEIVKTDLKSIKEEIKKNCEDIKKLELNFDSQNDYQSIDFSISKEQFFNILKYNSCKRINEINNIIGDINEKNKNIKFLNTPNYTTLNTKNEENKENITESEIENNNIHFTQLKLDINYSKLINENKLFREIKEEEYYAGIEGLQDHFNKENISQLYKLKNY